MGIRKGKRNRGGCEGRLSLPSHPPRFLFPPALFLHVFLAAFSLRFWKGRAIYNNRMRRKESLRAFLPEAIAPRALTMWIGHRTLVFRSHQRQRLLKEPSITRLGKIEAAHGRLERAIARLERAVKMRTEREEFASMTLSAAVEQELRTELERLEADHIRLENTARSVTDRLDGAIERLKALLGE